MQTLLGIKVCPFHQAIRGSLSIQAVTVCFMRKQIMCGLTISLNQGFISPMGALLSLIMNRQINFMAS